MIAAPKNMALMCRLVQGKEYVSLLPGDSAVLNGVPVQAVAAYNKSKPFHLKAMKWLGYILTIG